MCVPPPSPSCAEEAGYIAWYEIKAMIAAGAKVGTGSRCQLLAA